jgi:hypothetical protein
MYDETAMLEASQPLDQLLRVELDSVNVQMLVAHAPLKEISAKDAGVRCSHCAELPHNLDHCETLPSSPSDHQA